MPRGGARDPRRQPNGYIPKHLLTSEELDGYEERQAKDREMKRVWQSEYRKTDAYKAWYKQDRENPDAKKTRSEKAKRRYYKRRDFIWNLKSKPCMDCGESFHPAAMDFHHRDPSTKSFTITNGTAIYSLEKLMEEIAKCDLICANCHRIREHAQ